MIYYLAFSNGWLADAVVLTFSVGVNLFVGITAMYDRPLDATTVVLYIFLIATNFFGNLILNMLVV